MGAARSIYTPQLLALKETPRKVREGDRYRETRSNIQEWHLCSRAFIGSESRGDKEDGRESDTAWSRESVCLGKAIPGKKIKKSNRNLGS